MKKMSVIFFALAAVGCAVAFGNPKFSQGKVAIVKNGEVFKVIYEGPAETLVKVTILGPDDQEIFSEKIISHKNFLRPYNFSQLPRGDYKICVDDQNGQHVEKICNTELRGVDPDAMIDEQDLRAHVVKLKDAPDKYLVAIPKQEETEVEIHVYNQDHLLVFTEKQKLDQGFAKVYVLKNLEGATIGVAQQSGKEKLFRIE
jgi:hypothetical protein